jgi:1-acyl-sn-glycerol-3-phosphate acyltransferase
MFTLAGRLRIKGLNNLPRKSGAIIASNHLSLNDPPLVGCSVPWAVYFMAKRELFDMPMMGWMFRQFNTFPVNRDGMDRKAMRMAIRLLSEGKTVLMFPRGTRVDDEEDSFKFKNGIGMLSCMAQVPIIPCLVTNSNMLHRLRKMTVSFAEPVFPPEKYDKNTYGMMTESVIKKIKQLR